MKPLLSTLCLFLFSNLILAQPLSNIWPKQNQVLYKSQIELTWNLLPEASSYKFTISTNEDLSEPLLEVTQLENSVLVSLPMAGDYFWQISAEKNDGSINLSPLNAFTLFDPLQLSGMELWLNAEEVISDEQKRVSQWLDKSGLGNHVNQAVLNNQPLVLEGIINGLPALSFNGSNQYLDGGNILNFGIDSRQMFVVGQANTTGRFFSKALVGSATNRYALGKSSNNLNLLFLCSF